jgi:hypothetical protein
MAKANPARVNKAINTIGRNACGFGPQSGNAILHNVIIDFDKRIVFIPKGAEYTLSACELYGKPGVVIGKPR